jgi:hypothetical protein
MSEDDQIAEWVAANVGGAVAQTRRQARGRPVSFIDVDGDVDGEMRHLLQRYDEIGDDLTAADLDDLQLFHRRFVRYKMLTGSAGSAMATHHPIQRFDA